MQKPNRNLLMQNMILQENLVARCRKNGPFPSISKLCYSLNNESDLRGADIGITPGGRIGLDKLVYLRIFI